MPIVLCIERIIVRKNPTIAEAYIKYIGIPIAGLIWPLKRIALMTAIE